MDRLFRNRQQVQSHDEYSPDESDTQSGSPVPFYVKNQKESCERDKHHQTCREIDDQTPAFATVTALVQIIEHRDRPIRTPEPRWMIECDSRHAEEKNDRERVH